MFGQSKAFALCLLLATPVHAHAQVEGADETREVALEAYVTGDFDRAGRILETLLTENPEDADLLRRLAAVEAAAGNLAGAQRHIERAFALSPLDADIQLARANVLFWNSRRAEAKEQVAAIRRSHGEYPGLAALEQSLASDAEARRLRLHSISVGQSLSRANFERGGAQDWAVTRASASFALGSGSAATMEIEREDREAVDTRLFGRIDLPAGRHRMFLTANVTADPDFRENWSVSAGTEIDLGSDLHLLADAHFAEYHLEDIGVIAVGVRYQPSGAFWLTARTVNLIGGGEDYRLGGSLRADYAPARGSSFFALVASYPDAEIDGTRTLRSIAGGIQIALTERFAVRLSSEYESREDSYKRVALGADFIWTLGAR